jgi:hypothetical protein
MYASVAVTRAGVTACHWLRATTAWRDLVAKLLWFFVFQCHPIIAISRRSEDGVIEWIVLSR